MDSKYYQRIKETREANNLTQKRLAEMAGIAPGSLSAYENGNKTPPVDVAARLAKALSVSLDWLFGIEADESISQEPKTYADLIKLILLITESGLKVSPKFEPEYSYGIESSPDISSIKIEDNCVNRFFQSWTKIFELRRDKLLEDEIYQIWIEKKLEELSQEPIKYNWTGNGSNH